MLETPQPADAVGMSRQVKHPRYLQIGIALLAVAVLCLLARFEVIPNFLGFLGIPVDSFATRPNSSVFIASFSCLSACLAHPAVRAIIWWRGAYGVVEFLP